MTTWVDPEWADLGFPPCPIPPPDNPYDEDHYCDFCGNGSWKYHAPWCAWQDVVEGLHLTVDGDPSDA